MTAPSLGARGAHAVNENPTAARNTRYNTNKDYKNHQSYS
jgi:hypothetical protein